METKDTTMRRRLTNSADLIRRGAALLREPCPKCGGLQIKFQGKTYCINCDDVSSILSPPQIQEKIKVEQPQKEVVVTSPRKSSEMDSLSKVLEEKLTKASKKLETTEDVEEQEKLLDLISKYVETLEKVKKAA